MRGPGPGASRAGHRLPEQRFPGHVRFQRGGVCRRTAQGRLRRRPERHDRISLGEQRLCQASPACERSGRPARRGHRRHGRHRVSSGSASGDEQDSDRFHRRLRSGSIRPGRQPEPADGQRDGRHAVLEHAHGEAPRVLAGSRARRSSGSAAHESGQPEFRRRHQGSRGCREGASGCRRS